MFNNYNDAHAHSLKTLNQLYEYDDFMMSIRTVADIGCGVGKDLEWWATRTTRDDTPMPLNIECQGIDLLDQCPVARKYPNVTYQQADFEKTLHTIKNGFDILWCHNSFQYATNPLQTLANWKSIAAPGAMLCLILPQTVDFYLRNVSVVQHDGVYHHHTMVSLIHMLAVTGWDCRGGFFKKEPNDPWLHAIVYNSNTASMDPKTTRWYDLVDAKLLPESAEKSILSKGYLDQNDLLLPWLDKNLRYIGR